MLIPIDNCQKYRYNYNMSIIDEKLDKPYEDYTIRSKVLYRCDYCGKEFLRDKKSRERLNKNIPKDSCGDKSCRKLKQEEVNIKLHGCKSIFESQEFIEKQKQRNLEEYGVEQYFQSEDFQNKRKEKLKERYGVESPLQNKEIRDKQQQTCLNIHGTTNFYDKAAETMCNRYGEDNPMQVQEFKDKRDETCEEIFGAKNYTQTEEYWINRKAKCLATKGVEHESQLEENKEKRRRTCIERYNKPYYSQTDEFAERVAKIFWETLGVPNPLCLKENHKYGKTQEELRIWLNSFGFNFKSNCYKITDDDKELDLYDDNIKTAIEYNGLYWHTELSKQPRNRVYHYAKYLRCLDSGIRLINIFEDEWKKRNAQCKNILLATLGIFTSRVYARECLCEHIGLEEFDNFCDINHLLGKDNNGIMFYGLRKNGELLGAMSVGRHPRYSKRLALNRLCFKTGVQIIGGASRLFAKFKKDVYDKKFNFMDDKKIVTWSDNRWSAGNIYSKIGFFLKKKNGPDYDYVNLLKPYIRLSKQSHTKKLIGCPKDIKEHIWMWETRKCARIWDCGNKTWVYNFNPS